MDPYAIPKDQPQHENKSLLQEMRQKASNANAPVTRLEKGKQRDKNLQSHEHLEMHSISNKTPLDAATPPAVSRDLHWVLSMPEVVPSDIVDDVFLG